MSTANELLDSLTEEEIATYTADPETEEHIVIGSDRHITVPEALKRIGVQFDHNVETVTFDCPRYWDDIDMSTMKVYINYLRADGQPGCYIAENVTVDSADKSIMHFTWTISRNVTEVKGNLAFLVCIKKADAEGNETNHWNSEMNRDMYISEGLECGEVIVEEYADILEQWLRDLEEAASIVVPDEQVAAAVEAYMAENPVEPGDVSQEELEALATVVDGKLDKPATDGTAGQVLQLDENNNTVWVENKAGLTEIPDNYITPEKTTFFTSSDIEYEIVEGLKLNATKIVEDATAFTLFIKIPQKPFAWIAVTPSNTEYAFGTSTRMSGSQICDATKTSLGSYGFTDTNRNLCVIRGDHVSNYEGATYFATSYTLGSTFDIKIGGVGFNTSVDIPVAETELPDDFIISGGNKITEMGTNVWYSSSNDRWTYSASYYGNTNFFEVENGKTYYHNGDYVGVMCFDENYSYVGIHSATGAKNTITLNIADNIKYAYAYSTSATGIPEGFWFSDEDLSRKMSTPTKVVNPKYFEVELDRKHMNNWYNGKRASFMGDSLSANGTGGVYISDLKDYFGFSNVTTTAIGGTYVSGAGNGFGAAFWQDDRVNAVDIDSDIIFIMGGTNDANNNVSLGENDISNCDTNTFYGAYNVLISKLIYKFYKLETGYYADIDYSGVTQVETAKAVKIFLITPPYMLSNELQYEKTPSFAEAVVEIGKRLGCPVCDTRANSDINLFLADYYKAYRNDATEPDYVHLSSEAHHHWAMVIAGKMLEVEPII